MLPPPDAPAPDRPRALYVHVPFCPRICPYCDFHKMRRDERLVERYLARLEREAAELAARWPGPLDTIYLGGGTPSHLSDRELERVAGALERGWGFPARLETTLEADPGTFDRARLARLRALGFDRVSLGAQSFEDDALRFLGRAHDGRAARRALEWALEVFPSVSADLIAALPARVPRDLERDLRELAASGVPHASVYTLTVEPWTPFALRGVRVDEERAADDWELAERVLREAGLERYEVSSHARPGHEARHNRTYWSGAWFLALGPSAAALLPPSDEEAARGALGVRVTNPPIRAWLEGAAPERLEVGPEDWALERLMTGLRTRDGVDLDALAARTGVDARARWAGVLESAVRHGLLVADGPALRATPDGLARLDAVLRSFFAT